MYSGNIQFIVSIQMTLTVPMFRLLQSLLNAPYAMKDCSSGRLSICLIDTVALDLAKLVYPTHWVPVFINVTARN